MFFSTVFMLMEKLYSKCRWSWLIWLYSRRWRPLFQVKLQNLDYLFHKLNPNGWFQKELKRNVGFNGPDVLGYEENELSASPQCPCAWCSTSSVSRCWPWCRSFLRSSTGCCLQCRTISAWGMSALCCRGISLSYQLKFSKEALDSIHIYIL